MPSFTIQLGAGVPGAHDPFHAYLAAPGTFTVTPVAGTDSASTAWNAWSGAVDPDGRPDGSYRRGWLNSYAIYCPLFPASDDYLIRAGSGRWSSPDAALHAASPVSFELKRTGVLLFHIIDSYEDNVGGLTLQVNIAR